MVKPSLITSEEECVKEEDIVSWTLRESVARKNANNIWGKGFTFSSDDEEIVKKFHRINRLNNLDNLFSFVERQCSLFGRAVITINPTQSGDFMLNVTSPFWFNGVGRSFIQPQLAVIFQRVKYDNYSYVIKSTFTDKIVKNDVFGGVNGNVVRVYDKEAEILDHFKLKKVWRHNLGFPPIIELTNIPYYPLDWNINYFYTLSDWFPAWIYEKMIYETLDNLQKELRWCHSRAYVEGANQSIVAQWKKDGTLRSYQDKSDFVINTDGHEVKIQPGNGDFTKYTSALNDLYDLYYKLAGSSRFSEGGGAQKTVAETSSIRSAMIETINQKITLRMRQYEELFKKLLCCYGLIKDYWEDEDKFIFKINGNVLKDETNWIDSQIKLMNAGVISPIDFIEEHFNIATTEAKKKFEEIKKFNEENGIISMFNEPEGLEEGNFNQETGEHNDAVKKGAA